MASLHSAKNCYMAAGGGEEVTNSLNQLWTQQVTVLTCWARCARDITAMEITKHSLIIFEAEFIGGNSYMNL